MKETMGKTESQRVPPAMSKSFAPGQYLFHEGDPSNAMYLISKGTVSIRKYKGTAYVEIARLYSNEVLGELAFFDRQPRSASAVALTDVDVIELQFEALDKLFASTPDYMKTIIASVADRLRRANDTIRRLQKNMVSDLEGGKPGEAAAAKDAKEEIPNDIPATSPPPAAGSDEEK